MNFGSWRNETAENYKTLATEIYTHRERHTVFTAWMTWHEHDYYRSQHANRRLSVWDIRDISSNKITRIVIIMLKKENKLKRIKSAMLSYKKTVIITIDWWWDKYLDKWSRVENTEISLHKVLTTEFWF